MAGDGRWISATSANALAAAFAEVDDQEMIVRRAGTVAHTRPSHQPFLLASLGLIAAVGFARRFFLGAWL
jgi:hypothetical protein